MCALSAPPPSPCLMAGFTTSWLMDDKCDATRLWRDSDSVHPGCSSFFSAQYDNLAPPTSYPAYTPPLPLECANRTISIGYSHPKVVPVSPPAHSSDDALGLPRSQTALDLTAVRCMQARQRPFALPLHTSQSQDARSYTSYTSAPVPVPIPLLTLSRHIVPCAPCTNTLFQILPLEAVTTYWHAFRRLRPIERAAYLHPSGAAAAREMYSPPPADHAGPNALEAATVGDEGTSSSPHCSVSLLLGTR
ncbi:hypothetical protein FB45DRAFT_1064281 [Roridomyces roridus]|uniref:Uncharacterized protein n=1 Tax=Roridomyces roridus TaxID=1738132 RepID=A0AAD7BA18_9AGAR|nr:hypothetical protein FB45DRAFT_1064281 [Roridomyces roridus]